MSEIKRVTVKSNKEEVLKATNEAIEKALTYVGIEWQREAAAICPVVTGRLANSINYATSTGHGSGQSQYGTVTPKAKDTTPNATPKENTVVVGTNVEYAQRIEEGGAKEPQHSHFLRNSLNNNRERFKEIIEKELSGI